MKKGFVRGLWGTYMPEGKGIWARRYKHDNDVKLASLNPYEPEILVYVFGEENYKWLVDQGYKCKLVDKQPALWPLAPHCYRHKMEVWKQALLDFDEIAFLDWDCIPTRPIPSDFWDTMSKKASAQASLYMYTNQKISWRKEDGRKVAAATFVYLRDKDAGDKIIKDWEDLGKPLSEEAVLMKYIEGLNGGWKGVDDYRSKYESPYHTLFALTNDCRKVDDAFLSKIDPLFYHLNKDTVAGLLREPCDKASVKKRIDEMHEYRTSRKLIRNG